MAYRIAARFVPSGEKSSLVETPFAVKGRTGAETRISADEGDRGKRDGADTVRRGEIHRFTTTEIVS